MYETLEFIPADAILKLIDLFKADTNPDKVDLGVGVYQDATGLTPILSAIKKAELRRNETETTKTYFGPPGDPLFGEQICALILAEQAEQIGAERLQVLQTPGGSGGLRIAGELIRRASPAVTIWVSTPSWANHIPLLATTGMQLESYPYYDQVTHSIVADAMLEHLQDRAETGDIVLLHGSCHNPTGADLNAENWLAVADVCIEKGLIPFIDIAYHGFAAPISDDLAPVRAFLSRVPEAILAYSCSKNFGLYRDRTGALLILGEDKTSTDIAFSNAYNIVRTMYSVPPHHGAALVSTILADKALRAEWLRELDGMRGRIVANRQLLSAALDSQVPDGDFGFLQQQNGMFSLLGINKEQVGRLVNDCSIYLPDSGRINFAGVQHSNVEYIADSLAKAVA